MDYNEIRHKIDIEAKKRYYQDIEDIKKAVDRHYKMYIAYHIISFAILLIFEFICLMNQQYIICFICIAIKICIDQIIKHIYEYINSDYDDQSSKMLLLKTSLLKYKFDIIKELYPRIDIQTLKNIIDQDIINVCFIILHDEIISLSSICDTASYNVIGKISDVEIDCDYINNKIIINSVKIYIN